VHGVRVCVLFQASTSWVQWVEWPDAVRRSTRIGVTVSSRRAQVCPCPRGRLWTVEIRHRRRKHRGVCSLR